MSASPFWRIPRMWERQTVVCIGGGPSLTQAQVDACRGRARVIAINDAYRLCPWADMLYFCDDQWWRWHRDRPDYRAFAGIKVTLENGHAVDEPGVRRFRNMGREGFNPEPDGIKTGGNGGYQAMHVAAHAGAARIILLAYDMKPAGDGRTHWFGEHPKPTWPSVFENVMLKTFPTLAPELMRRGVEVINATPGSALALWPIVTIEEALAGAQSAAA